MADAKSNREPRLVPELRVSDFERSLQFYLNVLGFSLLYDRPEERFACLEIEGARLMIEEPVDEDRAELLSTGALEKPYGRGVSLQIEVADAEALAHRIVKAEWEPYHWPLFLGLEERWYRVDDAYLGNRQFWVQDVDEYLLRFFQDLRKKAALLDKMW